MLMAIIKIKPYYLSYTLFFQTLHFPVIQSSNFIFDSQKV